MGLVAFVLTIYDLSKREGTLGDAVRGGFNRLRCLLLSLVDFSADVAAGVFGCWAVLILYFVGDSFHLWPGGNSDWFIAPMMISGSLSCVLYASLSRRRTTSQIVFISFPAFSVGSYVLIGSSPDPFSIPWILALFVYSHCAPESKAKFHDFCLKRIVSPARRWLTRQ
jgi:hypothetical protein